MNTRLVMLAEEKRTLLMRSSLCRLRLRRGASDVRRALPWSSAMVRAAPIARPVVFALALSLVGASRITRFIAFAGRALLAARIARSVIAYARASFSAAGCAIEQTAAPGMRSLENPPRSNQ